ncbi:MAG: transporter substrate-binding protein [Deltaproteobacteria bacterium]|nr:transporter substrate-binding protein [Deltaproteobacteria bacterium]
MGVRGLELGIGRITPIPTFPRFNGGRKTSGQSWIFLETVFLLTLALLAPYALANPYLPKSGEAPVNIRVGTCGTSGGFLHFYAALANGLFDKYGIKVEPVTLRGGAVTLTALASDGIQFLYCSADPQIPRMAAGGEAKIVSSLVIGLPWVLMGRTEIKRPADLKGKTIPVSRPGGLTDHLAKAVLKKNNLTTQDVKLLHIGGTGQLEPYNALLQGLADAALLTPPLDVRAKRDGYHLIFNLQEPLKERPHLVQRFVAAMAETIHFVEKNPDRASRALGKALNIADPEILQSAYQAYARNLVNRRMTVPGKTVADAVELAREEIGQIRRRPEELFDNGFTDNLVKSGFLKELWGTIP